jgi:hypothetical protein
MQHIIDTSIFYCISTTNKICLKLIKKITLWFETLMKGREI